MTFLLMDTSGNQNSSGNIDQIRLSSSNISKSSRDSFHSGKSNNSNRSLVSVGSNSGSGTNVFYAKNNIELSNLDKLDDETFEKIQGSIYEIITSQNGSRCLQKIMKSTSGNILTKILDEVILLFTKDISIHTGINE